MDEMLKIIPKDDRLIFVFLLIYAIFNNHNVIGVANNPSNPTIFTIDVSYEIRHIETYHWNSGSGAVPGTITLLNTDTLVEYGPWQAEGRGHTSGDRYRYWYVHPNEIIPAGTYQIIDSDNSTWSHNAASGNRGFGWVAGVIAD